MIQVIPGLYRGSRPLSLDQLKSFGIDVVVNLQSGVYEDLHEDLYEQQLDNLHYKLDPLITVHELKFGDIFPPSLAQINEAVGLIQSALKQGKWVYVHCLHGMDRTGMVIAAYRIKYQGWSKSDAIKEMFDLGFHKFPYLPWIIQLLRLK